MKTRLILTIIGLALTVGLTLSQVKAVSAVHLESNPLTAPVTYFLIKGKVNYLWRGWLIPARGVKVEAVNTRTNAAWTAGTDAGGSYIIGVEPGEYKVKASDNRNTLFAPAVRIVKVVNSDISNISFFGYLRF